LRVFIWRAKTYVLNNCLLGEVIMAQSETVERILDAAEQLFAEKGFTETSLRLITSKAGVNLAAVNYHFGSKKALIQAVFSRFLGPFCANLERDLDVRQGTPNWQPTLEQLLGMLVEQSLAIKPRCGDDLSVFMRLLGLAFSQSQGHLRRYLVDTYGKVLRRYLQLLNNAAPQIPPLELFWRVHFMLGAAAFTMSGIKALRAIGENDFAVDTSIEQVMSFMVPFLAAGMRAQSAITDIALANANFKPKNRSVPAASK
jgi:AcrR family transcriptional regulator